MTFPEELQDKLLYDGERRLIYTPVESGHLDHIPIGNYTIGVTTTCNSRPVKFNALLLIGQIFLQNGSTQILESTIPA